MVAKAGDMAYLIEVVPLHGIHDVSNLVCLSLLVRLKCLYPWAVPMQIRIGGWCRTKRPLRHVCCRLGRRLQGLHDAGLKSVKDSRMIRDRVYSSKLTEILGSVSATENGLCLLTS